MRRVIGLILTGAGTFLIVCAVLLPTWVSSQVIKFPLNEYETATLAASNASYFSPTTLTEKTGVNLQATYTIKGDGAAGNSSTAVWDEYSYVYDLTNHQAVQQATRRFAFDRRTAVLVNCCGANINGDSSIEQRGYLGYVFPIGTQKQTYDVFDTTLNQPEPFVYSGTTDVHGIQAYEFVENIAPVQVGTQTIPGSLVGTSASSVTLPEYYQMHLIYYVDPATGALIDVNEHQNHVAARPRHRRPGPAALRRRPDRDADHRHQRRGARQQRAEQAQPGRDHPAPSARDTRRRRADHRDHPRP